ncbi:unnamed protein product [Hyaloperonospora brassicae]|uniref:BED-type domain-containing protein n=1 Tax=Hyaloperonospora brassicae TaxID=162125 RepID=A0AAV0UD85_HYABA|nr:unnamed protein product [Hyaloperonospora brassicae]
MPRPASAVWVHFSKELPTKRATCNYCGRNMCGLVLRMRTHLARKCPSCPEPIQTAMRVDSRRLSSPSAPVAKRPRASSDHHSPIQSPRYAPGPNPAAAAPATAKAVLDDATDLDGCVARALFEAGAPVTTVEHASFVQLCKRLKPTYTVPSALTLSTAVLDREYALVQAHVRAHVADAVALGLESSWPAAPTHLFVSCWKLGTPTAVDVRGVAKESSTGTQHGALTCNGRVDVMESLLTHATTTRLSVVVTDTTDSMLQAARDLQQKHPAVTFLPSCSYTMAAMMTEIVALPAVASTLATCNDLARFFAQDSLARHAIARVLASNQTRGMTAPWGDDPSDASPSAQLECLFATERNRYAMDILVADAKDPLCNMHAPVKERVTSLGFWKQVSTLTGLFEPFLDILKTFESTPPLLSTFYHEFTQLWTHVLVDQYGSLATKVRRLMSEYWQKLQHPAMYTAYLLDPRYPPSSLSGEATSEALAYIKRAAKAEVYKTIVDELTRFTARIGLFADDAIWESAQQCSPLHWWKGFIGGSCPNLQSVALRTLGYPTTSGLFGAKRRTFEQILTMNAKHMDEGQAIKTAVMHANSNLVSQAEDGTPDATRKDKKVP